MSPKRGDRVAPPPGDKDWDVRFASSEAVKGWDSLSQAAPGNTLSAWTTMRTSPGPGLGKPTHRHHPLKGGLATGTYRGRSLPQWQIEVTGGGRVWYLLDEHQRTVWVVQAGTGHPKATD